ncbi:hypothetical protein FBUS_07123, partial [Fasciolopsis buskii]
IVVNSVLKAGLEYQSHGHFQEWRDPISLRVYGLHFPDREDAQSFVKTINIVLNKLDTSVLKVSETRIYKFCRSESLDFEKNVEEKPGDHKHIPAGVHNGRGGTVPQPATVQGGPKRQPEYTQSYGSGPMKNEVQQLSPASATSNESGKGGCTILVTPLSQANISSCIGTEPSTPGCAGEYIVPISAPPSSGTAPPLARQSNSSCLGNTAISQTDY